LGTEANVPLLLSRESLRVVAGCKVRRNC